jgi:hypothetical protein
MRRVALSAVASSLVAAWAAAWIVWPQVALSHGPVTTTVLFDREIVRILNSHCVACHSDGSLAFPLSTYEQTWVRGRAIRTDVLRRHMPPWSAVAGYGQFVNDNSLTVRETQFMVSWVEGLGPRNAGTVFLNVANPGAAPPEVRASAHVGHWQLGDLGLSRPLAAFTVAPGRSDFVQRTVIDLGLTSPRLMRALEYMPGDRRVVRAAVFSLESTGQWLGSWTPWYGFVQLPDAVVARLPARSRVVAEIFYRGTSEAVVDRGTLGLFFDGGRQATASTGTRRRPALSSDLVLEATNATPSGTAGATGQTGAAGAGTQTLRATTRLAADTRVWALRPDLVPGITSIEISARTPTGGTEILLFARDPAIEWPTPYILKGPRLLRRSTELSVVARIRPGQQRERADRIRVTVSRY